MSNKYLSHIVSIVEEAIKRKKTTASRASKEAVGNFFMVRNMQKGQSPRLENIKKLCDILGLECYIGFSEDYPGLSVNKSPILGKTKKGQLLCECNLSLVNNKDLHKFKSISMSLNKASMVAFIINDDNLSPILSTGDIIFADLDDKCNSSQWEQFIGKPCIAQLKTKEAFICTLRRGDKIGKWNLEFLNNSQTLINQSLIACLPIRWMKKNI